VVKIRVAIVDKREVIRQGIARLLHADLNLEVVCISNTVQEILKGCCRHQPDIILISCPLYECGGIEAIQYLHERLPMVNIIHFTSDEPTNELVSAARAGVRAFLSPNIGTKNLINSITRVAEGDFLLSPEIAASLLAIFDSLWRYDSTVSLEDSNRLTPRERAVLELVKQGLTNREIATALFISENTAKVHVRNIMEKLHAHTRQQAVSLAQGEDLLLRVTEN